MRGSQIRGQRGAGRDPNTHGRLLPCLGSRRAPGPGGGGWEVRGRCCQRAGTSGNAGPHPRLQLRIRFLSVLPQAWGWRALAALLAREALAGVQLAVTAGLTLTASSRDKSPEEAPPGVPRRDVAAEEGKWGCPDGGTRHAGGWCPCAGRGGEGRGWGPPRWGACDAGGLVPLIRDMVGRGVNWGWPHTVPLVGMGWGLAQ